MATKVIEKITKKNQAELRGKLGWLYKNSDLSGYYASGIETEDGKICLIKKPGKIEKNFYFAEGMAGTINEASKQAEKVKRDCEFFISENIKSAGYEWELKRINEAENGGTKAFITNFGGCVNGRGMASLKFYGNSEHPVDFPPHLSVDMCREATDEEVQAYKKAVLAARDTLIKRLNTYLKRYGLSKVSAQVFWDER